MNTQLIELAPPLPKFKFHRLRDLGELPPPEWLIEGLIPAGSQVVLYGPSGHGKSFLAMDLAMSIAIGREWQGRRVDRKRVIYVAAEGRRGVPSRGEAWTRHNGYRAADLDDAFFAFEGVQMRERDDVDLLIQRIAELGTPHPGLIVLDTFSRCFVGGDENAARDVSAFVEAAARLQRFTGGSVLIVHHTGKSDSDIERGSSALRAGADVMMLFRRRGRDEVLLLENNKQKDAEEFDPIHLRLQTVPLGFDPTTGRELTSCVLVPAAAPGLSPRSPATLAPVEEGSLKALKAFPQGARSGEWRDSVGLPETTFHRVRRVLCSRGYVEKNGQRYCLTDTGNAFI